MSASSGRRELAAFVCGSRAWGVAGEGSDLDLTVVVEGSGVRAIDKGDGVDRFVFSPDTLRLVASQDPRAGDAFRVWADNLTILRKNIVRVDPAFEGELFRIADVDWGAEFEPWLRLNLGYLKSRIGPGRLDKQLYHLYRVRSIARRYAETGEFLSALSPEDLVLARDFRGNPGGREAHRAELDSIVAYLEGLL